MKLKQILIILCFLPSLGFVHGGESSGGGGNSAAAEFQTLSIWALNSLANRGTIWVGDKNINVSEMSRLILKVTVRPTTEKLFLGSVPVHAINYPDKKLIVLNQDNWASLSQNAKVQLCLHEFWGLAFADHQDDNYAFSSALTGMVLATAYKSPSQVVSAVSMDTSLGGQTLRAMVVRSKEQDQFVQEFVVETIEDYPEVESVITAHISYSVQEMPVVAKWGFQNLRMSADGFEFELNYYLPDQVTCLYEISGRIYELKKNPISCHPTTPGQIQKY